MGGSPAFPSHELRNRVPELIDLVGLKPHRDKRLQQFSKGMLQRIGLAQALIHNPELIFLDEPTSGLDPMGRRLVRDIIRAQRDRGATVFLNSHLLSEIEITCDQVVFHSRGRGGHRTRSSKRPGRRNPSGCGIKKKMTPEIVAGLAAWTTSAHLEADTLTLTTSSRDKLPGNLAPPDGLGRRRLRVYPSTNVGSRNYSSASWERIKDCDRRLENGRYHLSRGCAKKILWTALLAGLGFLAGFSASDFTSRLQTLPPPRRLFCATRF